MKENTSMTKRKVKVFSLGQKEKSMMAAGKMANNTAWQLTNLVADPKRGNGKMEKDSGGSKNRRFELFNNFLLFFGI